MLNYTADDLWTLSHPRPPARVVRKAIFSAQLWLPRKAIKSADLSVSVSIAEPKQIPVVTGRRKPVHATAPKLRRPPVRLAIQTYEQSVPSSRKDNDPPTLYALNAAAMTKPRAIEHLGADLAGYRVDIAVITESHLKLKHSNHNFHIQDYTLFRRDRIGRRGGGVAVYVHSRLEADVWTCPRDSTQFELLWIRVQMHDRDYFVGGIYHPPKPLYQTSALLDCIEASVDTLAAAYPNATVVLAGDFNGLDDADVSTRSMLTGIVHQPTRGSNVLDRVYVNDACYDAVKVVTSAVRSDHKAVIAYTGAPPRQLNKTRERRAFRRRSPTQHALFLEHASRVTIDVDDDASVQCNSDAVYAAMCDLLDAFYPERQVTVTSSDPRYITPAVKAMLRRKNRLMRAGRINEADAIAFRVRKVITRQSMKWLRDIDVRKNAKDAWAKVREITRGTSGGNRQPVSGITAQMLNEHYAATSTDANYQPTQAKHTTATRDQLISEHYVFRQLDTLKPTATGLDGIPAWFLRVGAPIFAAPLARLFSQSLTVGTVPQQWKTAIITPVQKVPRPTKPCEFRPISVTPVLSRSLEKYVVRQYIYPALRDPPPQLQFDDQYAFRPTGSTSAAIIAMLHTVRTMLSSSEYVHIFAFDFSKAFDTVRHATLMHKLAMMQIPDSIYNWVRDFFTDRHHSTRYAGQTSTVADIKASVIQGSGLGPAAFLVTAADLHPLTNGNRMFKYADDTYLLVPAANSSTGRLEVEHIGAWAANNNLTLNRAKSKEMIVRARGKRGKSANLPALCLDIERVSSLRVLGVTVNDQLTAAGHVTSLLSTASSLLYALRMLRGHGIGDPSLHDVCRATLMAKLIYAAPAWSGACSAAERAKLDSLVNRCRRLGYCSPMEPTFSEMTSDADDRLFASVMNIPDHVLQPLLPDRPDNAYTLRQRPHGNKRLINKTVDLNDNDFIVRAMYKNSY